MFSEMSTTELTAFAVSHVRNDIQFPVDLAVELFLRGIDPAMLASAVELVSEVEEWDAAYDSLFDVDDVIDAEFDNVIGGTD